MSSDGELTVLIPAGAVQAPTTFTIQAAPGGGPGPPPGRQQVARVWHLTASNGAGQVVSVLERPVKIVFHYRAATPQFVAFWDGQEWVNLDTAVDTAGRTATASTSQLSELAALGPATSSGSPATAPGGQLPLLPMAIGLVGLVAVGAATYFVRTRLTPVSDARTQRPSSPGQPRAPGAHRQRSPRRRPRSR